VKQAPTRPLAIVGAVVAGGFMAVQARVNSGLSVALESGVVAAFISFSSGLAIIGLIVALSKKDRDRLRDFIGTIRRKEFPLWGLTGGLLGGIFVITQGTVAGVIGISLFAVAVVTGQALAALLIDGRGLLGMKRRPLGGLRVMGTILAIAGLVVAGDFANYSFQTIILLPFLAGIGIGFQQALNSNLGQKTDSAVVATLINFVLGTSLIAIALLVANGGFQFSGELPTNPVLYLGGLVGVVFIFVQVVLVPKIGTLAMGVSLLVGQLSSSLLLDLVTPISSRGINGYTFTGVTLALLGATLVASRR
jgi:transporter family-2 protein